ncbi:hypothetical protein vseg_016567 [Gypsophila vaccaria]
MEDIGITSVSEVRRREEVEVDGKEGEKRQKLEEKLVEEDVVSTPKQGGGGVGLLDNLLAKLSSPKPTSNPVDLGDFEDFGGGVDVQSHVDPGAEGEGGVGAGGGGGVISNMISSFFHRGGEGENVNGHHDGGEEEVKGSKNEGVDEVKKDGVGKVNSEGKSVNGGSIISNLVPDDVVPASDEASILIHSVVHD